MEKYEAAISGVMYPSLGFAIRRARVGESVAVIGDADLTESVKIKTGVTVTIGEGVTVTVASGVELEAAGVLVCNGKIINDGKITLPKHGRLRIGGEVVGAGTVEVLSGGEITQPLEVPENLAAMYRRGVLPEHYEAVGMSCEYTIYYGGRMTATVSAGRVEAEIPVVGYSGSGKSAAVILARKSRMHILPKGRIMYEKGHFSLGGRTEVRFYGGAKFRSFDGSAGSFLYSTGGLTMPVARNLDIFLGGSAEYFAYTDFRLQSGANLTVGEGSVLTLIGNTAFENAADSYITERRSASCENIHGHIRRAEPNSEARSDSIPESTASDPAAETALETHTA